MQLTKPIILFDLETTSVNTVTDRIVQIGTIRFMTDGTTEEKNVLINPTIPIPADIQEFRCLAFRLRPGRLQFRQL